MQDTDEEVDTDSESLPDAVLPTKKFDYQLIIAITVLILCLQECWKTA